MLYLSNIFSMKKTTATLLIASLFSTPLAFADGITLTYTGNGGMLGVPITGTGSGYLYPGSVASPSASNNRVIIDYVSTGLGDPNNPTAVYGGFSSTGNANNNVVEMHNGQVGTGNIFGGNSASGTASNNQIMITGGTVEGHIHGGSGTNGASYNQITITGGTIENNVYGGVSPAGDVMHNHITIGPNAILRNIWLMGSTTGGSGDLFTGNTLHIIGNLNQGGWRDGLLNFEHLHFTLPENVKDGDTMLRVNNVNLNSNNTGVDTKIQVDQMSGGRALEMGETIKLFESFNIWTGGSVDTSTIQGMKGVSLIYDFDITAITSATYGGISATVTGVRANPQTHALLQGPSANIMTLKQAGDLVSGQGLSQLRMSAQTDDTGFVAASYDTKRVSTGSHVDVDTFNLLVGAVFGRRGGDTRMALGPFVEMGYGSYDSYNSFAGQASVRGNGNTRYIGAGVLGSIEKDNGFNADASLRLGYTRTEFESRDLSSMGEHAEYDSSVMYVSAHATAGYKLSISETDTIDLYARYLWTHMGSDRVKVVGDTYHFDSVDSHRVRSGLRYTHALENGISPYAGVAYDYEFDGEAKGQVYGYDLDPVRLKGGTVIGEIGLDWQMKDTVKASFAIEGYTGKADGFGGVFRLNARF